jgi:hypothetical protein
MSFLYTILSYSSSDGEREYISPTTHIMDQKNMEACFKNKNERDWDKVKEQMERKRRRDAIRKRGADLNKGRTQTSKRKSTILKRKLVRRK